MTTVEHSYTATLTWSDPKGTDSFSTFTRDHEILLAGKEQPIEATAAAWFRGNPARHTPGELLLAALASGHMMRFLEIAADRGLVVVAYRDETEGRVQLSSRGDGKVGNVVLRPSVTVRPGPLANESEVRRIHECAGSVSVVRRSVAVDVTVAPGPLTVQEESPVLAAEQRV